MVDRLAILVLLLSMSVLPVAWTLLIVMGGPLIFRPGLRGWTAFQ